MILYVLYMTTNETILNYRIKYATCSQGAGKICVTLTLNNRLARKIFLLDFYDLLSNPSTVGIFLTAFQYFIRLLKVWPIYIFKKRYCVSTNKNWKTTKSRPRNPHCSWSTNTYMKTWNHHLTANPQTIFTLFYRTGLKGSLSIKKTSFWWRTTKARELNFWTSSQILDREMHAPSFRGYFQTSQSFKSGHKRVGLPSALWARRVYCGDLLIYQMAWGAQ